MNKFDKNKFKIKPKSLSLSKINPYYDNKENYLPYKYKDPSFKTQYNGPLMQKDLYILNLMNNRLKKVLSYKSLERDELPLIQSTPIEVSKKTDIVFNSVEFEKQQLIKEYTKFAFIKLKNSFFNFDPVSSKNDLIQYRKNKNKFRAIPIHKERLKYNPKTFMINFQKQIIQNNCQNWEKIKEEYEKKELNELLKKDKYYDENKIWEVLNIKKKNVKNEGHKHITEGDKYNKDDEQEKVSLPLSENKRICIFKSENKNGKKIFSPIKFKEKENI